MIDQNLNKDLINRFSPENSILAKHHTRLLEILLYFDQLCKDNGIRYWLSSGTALGAVRHGGFIPWDDDADVEMLREDFEKLSQIFTEKDGYALQTKDTDAYYSAPYGKFRDIHSVIEEHPQDLNYKYKGVYIDIFIIEKCPSLILFKVFARLGWNLVLLGGNVDSIFKKTIYHVWKSIFFIIVFILRQFFRFIPTKRYRHCLGSTFPSTRCLNDILPTKDINFEGHKFPVPNDTDAYLTKLYGDYMILPDFDKLHVHVSKVEIY